MTLRSKPLARWIIGYLRSLRRYFFGRQDYSSKMSKELNFYRACENVHDLPEMFHYWSNKYLVPKFKPFGFSNPQEFFCENFTSMGSQNRVVRDEALREKSRPRK